MADEGPPKWAKLSAKKGENTEKNVANFINYKGGSVKPKKVIEWFQSQTPNPRPKLRRRANTDFGLPRTGDRANMRRRHTLVTPDVEHTLCEYESIPGTRENYCYVLRSDSDSLIYRRYFCTSCEKCLVEKDFEHCTNKSCGSWKNYTFKKK